MARFKENDLSERRAEAAKAKKAMLDRFRARPADDDPEVVARRAARVAASQAREARRKEREAARLAEQKAREEEERRLAAEEAERLEKERREEADRAVALLAEQKAARDARYAARKKRRR